LPQALRSCLLAEPLSQWTTVRYGNYFHDLAPCCECSSTLQVKATVAKQEAEPKLSRRKRTKRSIMA
jgi:hypothetical protein